MKLTRNLVAILTLASFSFAFAGEPGMGATHHGASAAGSKEMKYCGQCKGLANSADKASAQCTVKAPAEKDYSGLEYNNA